MKYLFTAAALLVSLSASAVIQGDGYYRVQNYESGRYIYVLDNKGSLNFQATTADLGALEVWTGYDRTISDPATVIYVTDVTGKNTHFDLQAQGTGVEYMIERAVRILKDKKGDFYRVYGEDSGLCRYIGDGTEYESEQGYVSSIQPYSSNYVKWYFHPISLDESQYFGVKPTVDANGAHYASFYASFPFSTASDGMKVWYVSCVDKKMGVAVVKEIEGTVPAATPVYIECSSTSASANKLKLGGSASAISDNILGGVYFQNRTISHRNLTTYYPKTMRVLGKTAEGKLGFITASMDYLPRNQAYLPVPSDTPAELSIMTEEEYRMAGVVSVDADAVTVKAVGNELVVDGLASGMLVEVFNIAGTKVFSGSQTSVQLPSAGLYIVRIGNRAYKIVSR